MITGINVERLFGRKGLCAKDFDDNALGRGLDKIAQYGTSKLLSELSFELLSREGTISPCRRMVIPVTNGPT